MVTPEDLNSNSSNRSNSSPVTYVAYDTIGTAGDPAPRVHSSIELLDYLITSLVIVGKSSKDWFNRAEGDLRSQGGSSA